MPPTETPQPAPMSAPTPAPATHMRRSVWIAVGIIIVLVLGILVGVQLAHSNSDYVCSAAVSDSQQGACTGGSWGPWQNTNGTLTRTYTGTRTTISFAGRVNGVSCSHPAYSREQATGTYTTEYAACQIAQTGTATAQDAATGTNGVPSNGRVTVSSQTETTGAVATSTQGSGSYGAYEDAVDAALATSSISAVPSIVRPRDTSVISWTSSHVKSCTVVGDNGDKWPKSTTETQTDADGNQTEVTNTPPAITGSETSSPITQQTVYTLTCITNRGRTLTDKVTVTILPTYQEQ